MSASEIDLAAERFRKTQIRSRFMFIGILVVALGAAIAILSHFYFTAQNATVQTAVAVQQTRQAVQGLSQAEGLRSVEAQKNASLATLISGTASTSPAAKQALETTLSTDPYLQSKIARVFIQLNKNPNGSALAKQYQRQLNAAGIVAIPDVEGNEHTGYELHYYYDDEQPEAQVIQGVLQKANPGLKISLVLLRHPAVLPKKETFALYLPSN